MKKIALLSIATLLAGIAHAQKTVTPPAAVKAAFDQKFPKATAVTWGKENATEFEAEFTNGSVKQAANFNAKSVWVVTETTMTFAELPGAVSAAVTKSYPGYKPAEVEKVETPKTALIYEVKMEKGETAYVVQLSPEGKILKKEKEKEEKEEKDEKKENKG